MPAYRRYVRDNKRREAVLGAKLSALNRKASKLLADAKAERARWFRFVAAEQAEKAKESRAKERYCADEANALAHNMEAVVNDYAKEKTCAALG